MLVDWELIPIASGHTLAELREVCPEAVVIVLSSQLDARQQAALSLAVDAFIRKGEVPDQPPAYGPQLNALVLDNAPTAGSNHARMSLRFGDEKMSEIEEMSTVDASVYSPIALARGAILVIDDNAAMREALVEILSLVAEVAVYAAANGHEGLQLLQECQDVALILLDMNMPVMNGEETYRNLQQLAPDVKVIIATSLNPTEVRSRLGEQEMPAYLQKPYDVATLLDFVQSVATASG